jgi:hypothetical protein
MDHGEWDALAVGWALSALDPHDEARFAVHLPTCDRCTDTVRESLRTVADLAYALPDDAPPAGLKHRILSAAAAEPRRAVDGPAPGPLDEASLAAPGPEPGTERGPSDGLRAVPSRGGDAAPGRDDTVVPLVPRRRRWTAGVASAAAVVLIAALGVWNLRLRADQDELRQIVAQREAAIAQLTADGPAQVAAVQAVNAKLEQQSLRRATIVVQNGRTQIIVESLDPRVGRDSYWLWTLNCDVTDLKPITGFQVRQRGFSIQNVGSDPGLATTQCFALSAESAPGTPSKPGTVVAVGQLR